MNTKSNFWGFVFGGAIGAVLALLYAPQSGEKTRKVLLENSQKAKEDALTSIQEAQDNALTKITEVQTQFEDISKEAKRILAQLQEVGKTTVSKQRTTLEKGYEGARREVITP